MPDNKWAAPTPIGNSPEVQHGKRKSNDGSSARKVPHKWQRWLTAVLESPKTSRELQHPPVFDHVAHSTASEVRKMGVEVITEMVTISGYVGEPARVARYSIAPESRDRAIRLLGDQP